MNWIPLHCHTQYSILDATCSIPDLVKKANSFEIPALSITDHGNMHGVIDFYKECKKQNIKPIIGSELYIAKNSRFEKKKQRNESVADHIVLLCKNSIGYKNLCILSSAGYTEGFYYVPRIDKDLLSKHKEGLVCLSACLSGSVARAALKSYDLLLEEASWYKEVFGEDYYLEVQRHNMTPQKIQSIDEDWVKFEYHDFIKKQERANELIIQASKELNIKLVATNDIHYIEPLDYISHEVLLNIQSGERTRLRSNDSYITNPKRKIYSSREFYFKSPQEMAEIFKDIPESITNTHLVADKCNLSIDFSIKHYPVFIPPGWNSSEKDEDKRYTATSDFLKKLCYDNIPIKYKPAAIEILAQKFQQSDPLEIIHDRLSWELDLIISKGMSDYILIVWDIIHWAKQNKIPTGPGRGSGAGSVILYLLGITYIEPIRFDLFFERFINPERISYPDIDMDICMDGRERVIQYTTEKYGKENVAQIISFGTMKAKMVVKDVGRVLDVPLAKVNQITKFIPDLQPSLTAAIEKDPDLYEMYSNDEDVKLVLDLGKKLERSIRNTGIHAAGVIICGEPLTNKIPICTPKEASMITTQFSMKPVEMVGMLKMDFLGLKTLTCIQIASDAIASKGFEPISWETIPLDDLETFKLLQQGKTLGVFQMESAGMQELSKNLQPNKFEEIIAIGALYRPGPMDMIPSFINRKHGREEISYDHIAMKQILKETYGIMVYQEQVMQIAQNLAGYSLGEGDVLRRAMGKKDVLQMELERQRFCKGAESNNISSELSESIFDKMEKFASYGFNKSHAAAYGLITYTTAFLKANFPKEWMASLLTCDQGDVEKVGKFIREAKSMGIAVLPPDINESSDLFVATEQGIRFSMSAIKGIGHGAVESIIAERQLNGTFKSLYDFISRPNLNKINKKAIENLIDAGCFDFLNLHKDKMIYFINKHYDSIHKSIKEEASGVMTFFVLLGNNDHPDPTHIPDENITFRETPELLQKEKELLGFYLTEHPMDAYRHLMQRLSCVSFSLFDSLSNNSVIRTSFVIDSISVKLSKNNKKFAILRISDGFEFLELPVWPELFEAKKTLLVENNLLYSIISVDKRGDETKFTCRWLADLSDISEEMIEDCDKEFNKIAMQISRSQAFKGEKTQMNSNSSNSKKTNKETDAQESVDLHLEISQITMNFILALKTSILNNPGSSILNIVFMNNGSKIGKIKVNKLYKINAKNIDLIKNPIIY